MATIESTTEIRPLEPELFPKELRAAFTSLRDERRSS